jgi:hypothetical protein
MIDIYRYQENRLQFVQTLRAGDTLRSPLLPVFACVIDRFFEL